MATKKPAATKPSSAVAVKKNTSVVSIKEQMALDLGKLQGKTAPASGNKIRITQDKQFVMPDGSKSPGPIDIVIVDFVSMNSYYQGAYDPKNIVPPTCFAIGSNPMDLTPSKNSPEIQSTGCTLCPMNAFDSAPVGNGKACKNARRLAVLPIEADADSPMMILEVSATALGGFDAYVNSVARQFTVPPYGVVTSVSFNPNLTYSSLVFGDPRPNEDLEVAYSRREEADTLLAVEPDVSGYVAVVKKPVPGRRK